MTSDATDNTMRAEFEAWVLGEDGSIDRDPDHGAYLHTFAYDSWTVWQAARADTARQVANWQPIETAPKDGSCVDLWFGNEVDPMREPDATWAKPKLGNRSECWCRKAYDECFGWIDEAIGDTPTHWMPLPTPPTDAAQWSKPDREPSEDGYRG